MPLHDPDPQIRHAAASALKKVAVESEPMQSPIQ